MIRKHKRSFDLLSAYDGYVPSSWASIAGLAGWLIVGVILANVVSFFLILTAGENFVRDYGTIISYPLMFLPAMLYTSARSHVAMTFDEAGIALDNGRFQPFGAPLTAIMVAVATVCTAVIIEPLMALLPEMTTFWKDAMNTLTKGPLWGTILTTCIFAPFFEEWLCRGMVLRGLLQSKSPATAIAVSALFFALIHMNPWQALPAFILGCLFGYVYYKTGSLKLTMLMHCANNAFSVLMTRIPGFEDCDYLYQGIGDWHVYGIIYGVSAGIAVAIIKKLTETNFTYNEE